jgi:hypothetical protein
LIDQGSSEKHGNHRCSQCDCLFLGTTLSPHQEHDIGAEFKEHKEHEHPYAVLKVPIQNELVRVPGKYLGTYFVLEPVAGKQSARLGSITDPDVDYPPELVEWAFISHLPGFPTRDEERNI